MGKERNSSSSTSDGHGSARPSARAMQSSKRPRTSSGKQFEDAVRGKGLEHEAVGGERFAGS